jgi:hypothetical protein
MSLKLRWLSSSLPRRTNDPTVPYIAFRRRKLIMSKAGTDYRDIRSGAYDRVSKDGMPQPEQVRDKTSPHQAAQGGADVRAELPGTEPVLPEGLTRPRRGFFAKTGRRDA